MKNDLLLIKSRIKANDNVRRLHMSGVQSSILVKLAQLQICIYNLLIKRKEEDSKINLKTLCKISKITGRHWWLSLDVKDLIHKRTKIKREYYKLKGSVGLSDKPT